MLKREPRHLANDGFLEFGYARALSPTPRPGDHVAILYVRPPRVSGKQLFLEPPLQMPRQ